MDGCAGSSGSDDNATDCGCVALAVADTARVADLIIGTSRLKAWNSINTAADDNQHDPLIILSDRLASTVCRAWWLSTVMRTASVRLLFL